MKVETINGKICVKAWRRWVGETLFIDTNVTTCHSPTIEIQNLVDKGQVYFWLEVFKVKTAHPTKKLLLTEYGVITPLVVVEEGRFMKRFKKIAARVPNSINRTCPDDYKMD